ncbi:MULTISPECIES: UbiA-like polyprenyltransferase [Aneurinibacillus]|uniref:4-hydroxybenzoate polyprenyltransferase n=1 Tax=Aneurinibacillus thermoaerophilus TaxID=143495 RepID=A0A1G8BQN4_ANETH|nr:MULTISPECIES: UbiA-like polyprenyltransferase [Aneurinibacillus]AMA73577.1 4-hydroxybenzoate octaprenyltransferase [Aneurinibacillus sp. XH2]MED0674968.1 UbiA-like polyprenyltransferase [Aneurinibacillus thermoaerophilus]MED0679631.1 UbiA-like polyprenyltransferase [Aneurinibacillus thermoaerophilus]MED0737371.1 UbiA-like polyprenyltransferase [Aneurinibacillus thermoaerophilus]MED0756220.1 UbiA-like polyprenyltransferase [Aneurinibacillus thermoaerophilus]
MRKLKIILEMIKFEHTVFALPFAFMGAILGSFIVNGTWPTWWQIFWIIVAMVGARSAAMALNRLIDRHIDAENPRTAMRAIPAGLIKEKEVVLFILGSFILLFIAAFQLNMLAVKLLPIAVFFLVFYSYTKRFTWACHLVLGIAIGLAPLGGWVATTGQVDWMGMLLFVSVALWTAGFDVIYACQDADFDRKRGLYSIPSYFGISKALKLARLFHLITMAGFVVLYFITSLHIWFAVGIIIAALILIYEHRLVSPNDLSKLNTAFFTMNGILSVVVFSFTLLDLVMR